MIPLGHKLDQFLSFFLSLFFLLKKRAPPLPTPLVYIFHYFLLLLLLFLAQNERVLIVPKCSFQIIVRPQSSHFRSLSLALEVERKQAAGSSYRRLLRQKTSSDYCDINL
jgi:hypothetical protein